MSRTGFFCTWAAACIAAVFCALPVAVTAAESADATLKVCLVCHGDAERAALPNVPALGAQPLDYLTIQLYLFREKIRPIEPMTPLLAGMKDNDLKNLAAAIAKLPAPPAANAAAEPARVERAQALVVQHRCNFCHNRDYSGQQNVPRLAGQREDYLLKALRQYAARLRCGDG